MAAMMMQVQVPAIPTEQSRVWRATKMGAWALLTISLGVTLAMRCACQEIFMDAKYIPTQVRTFHIRHPWAKKPTEDIVDDYNKFQDILNASLHTLKTARVASLRGHVLGKAMILHPPYTDSPSRQLFPEGDKTGHEQPQDHKPERPVFTEDPQPPTEQPVTRPSVLKISGANVLDGSTIGAAWTPQDIQCGAGHRPG
eukprot:CAMPEP_0118950328 /NCGR_PEP_ID=MMETSP1169-20130426/51199_1 /TAXON_ID=36882 /ORGANISM="Pyramimonas obovata, Strain CCMP722" /LENGTH=197 /DNA_ID=CAMNT_0006897143 /DNA_START=208 /DNA_END=797 /DNA_ORIENTATION=+